VPESVEEIEADELEEVLERVGAIDVAKASGKVCVRIPGKSRRITRVWDVAATTGAIMALPTSSPSCGSNGSCSRRPRTTGGPFFLRHEAL